MVVIWEPYRGFYLFLELLSLKEYCGNPVTNLKHCIRQYTHFPDMTNNYLKPSLNNLEKHKLISWKYNISDFNVNVIGTIDDLISEYSEISVNRNKIKMKDMNCRIRGDVNLTLDEIYDNNIYRDVVFAFFHNDKYHVEYFPVGVGDIQDRTIVIQLVDNIVEKHKVGSGVAKDFVKYFT